MLKLIAAIFSTFALFWAGLGVGVWWEHRPAGFPTVRVWLFHWTAPDSLAAQLAQDRTALIVCTASVVNLRHGIDDQNAAVEALRTETANRDAALRLASQEGAQARAVAESYRQRIAAVPVAPGASCPALRPLFTEALR